MFGRIKAVITFVAAAGMIAAASAVGPQTVQDSAKGNRLIINGQPLFISGMNIAWHDFGRDVGDVSVNINAMEGYLKQIKDAGGNAVRWWLHTDARGGCPKINNDGAVTGYGSKTIANMQQVLDIAYAYGIVVSMCLFSFDLLQNDGKTADQVAKNEKFLTVPANLDSYITNALTPILNAVGSHPAIMCWEVFNEPEGMITKSSGGSGWASRTIDYSHVIRFTAKIAAEVHKRTKKMASTGIHEFNKANYFPKYTIAKLKEAAGGDADAYLDFYMAHHYPEYIGEEGSPFKNPASFWGLEKPVLIGEFPARDWPAGYSAKYSMTVKDAYEYAYNNGYCGAMSWSMTEGDKAKFGSYETTKSALENLYAKHRADIEVLNNPTAPPPPPPATGFTVTFVMNSNSATPVAQPQTVSSGEKITKPADPARSGYTFDGWYKEAAFTTPWDFNIDVVNSNTTIYAKWNGASTGTVAARLVGAGAGLTAIKNGLAISTASGASVTVFGLSGNVVRKQAFTSGNHTVKLGDLPSGMYLVRANVDGVKRAVRVAVQ